MHSSGCSQCWEVFFLLQQLHLLPLNCHRLFSIRCLFRCCCCCCCFVISATALRRPYSSFLLDWNFCCFKSDITSLLVIKKYLSLLLHPYITRYFMWPVKCFHRSFAKYAIFLLSEIPPHASILFFFVLKLWKFFQNWHTYFPVQMQFVQFWGLWKHIYNWVWFVSQCCCIFAPDNGAHSYSTDGWLLAKTY